MLASQGRLLFPFFSSISIMLALGLLPLPAQVFAGA